MIVLERPEFLPLSVVGTVISVGNFDGLHRGHARLVQRAKDLAAAKGLATLIFTFDPHPAVLLRPENAPIPLVDRERKLELFRELGVDILLLYPTDRDLLQLTWHEFLEEIVWKKLRARAIVEGPDFRFGRNREGRVTLLNAWAQERGIEVEIVPTVTIDGQVVSSSNIRLLLAKGEVAAANRFLLEPYRVRGRVGIGAQRGRQLGYPTANLTQVVTLLPADGIYAGRAFLQNRTAIFPAAISLGPNPTFTEEVRKFEVFLLDFCGDLYGQVIEVEFLERLRDVRRFSSVAELLAQMERDVAVVRQVVEKSQVVNMSAAPRVRPD